MDALKNTLCLLILISVIGCGVSFETLTLEDAVEVPEEKEGMRFFKARKVFQDDATNVWGLEKDDCKDFQTFSGFDERGTVLKLDWAKTTCDWVGFGIGWNNWAAKDLGGIMENADLVMDIRAIEKESNIPIIVFLLEDYAGNMSAAVAGGSSLERYPVDEQWQEVRIPMSSFDYQDTQVDLTNIKQLVMEVQGYGSIFVDDIRIEDHEERVVTGKREYPPYVVKGEKYALLFNKERQEFWGLGEVGRRSYTIANDFLKMEWDFCKDCYLQQMGTTWENWKGVDYSENYSTLFLKLEISNKKLDEGDVSLIFDTYPGPSEEVSLSRYADESNNDLHSIFIPFSEFSNEPQFWERIKQLRLQTEGVGSINIHRIEIVNDGAQ